MNDRLEKAGRWVMGVMVAGVLLFLVTTLCKLVWEIARVKP